MNGLPSKPGLGEMSFYKNRKEGSIFSRLSKNDLNREYPKKGEVGER